MDGKQNQGWASTGACKVSKKEEASRLDMTHLSEGPISRSRKDDGLPRSLGLGGRWVSAEICSPDQMGRCLSPDLATTKNLATPLGLVWSLAFPDRTMRITKRGYSRRSFGGMTEFAGTHGSDGKIMETVFQVS